MLFLVPLISLSQIFRTFNKMNPEYISPHFTLQELCKSSVADSKGIKNIPSESELSNLRLLCQLLEFIRCAVGRPLVISSGFRCPELNKLVGGVVNSQHTKGLAADIVCYNSSDMSRLVNAAKCHRLADQIISEYSGRKCWLHVSVSNHPRHQIFNIVK